MGDDLLQQIIAATQQFADGAITKEEHSDKIFVLLFEAGKLS